MKKKFIIYFKNKNNINTSSVHNTNNYLSLKTNKYDKEINDKDF